VIAAGSLAARVAGGFAAVMAAVWLATSPVALIESMQVMSDVPATAAWLWCWYFMFRDRPASAGLASAVAILIRPNLAPLVVLPAAYFLANAPDRRWRLHGAFMFAIPAAAAALAVAFLQWLWFGSALRSGYGTAAEIYSLSNVLPNIGLYGQWLVESHGPFPLIAGLTAFGANRDLRWMLLFAASVAGAYLIYAQFEVWTYLRFLLPALAVAMIASATLVATLVGRLSSPARVPILAVIVLGLFATNVAAARRLEVFHFADRHVRARVVGERLATELPANAAIVSGEQSGSMRYYTGRSILRWDLMDDAAMQEAATRLTQRGFQLWVVLDDWEEEPFRRRLPALAAASLDYEPMVESAAGVGIRTRAWRVRSAIAASSKSE
jgi:hypothetical protein